MKAHTLKRIFAAGALALIANAACAAWPDDRPIELVVGFAPGGGTDVMARLVAQHLEKRLSPNARIIVINKPGAGGEIAVRYVAAAKPDGYTLGMINAPGFVYLPLRKGAKYKPEDIRLIARLVDDPLLFIKRRGSSAPDDLPGLVQKLKQSSESLSFGHSGDGTTGHLALMDLERSQGVRGNSVPFKGGGDIRLGVLGNHIDYGLITVSEVPELNDPNGPFAAIAITSDERHNGTIPPRQRPALRCGTRQSAAWAGRRICPTRSGKSWSRRFKTRCKTPPSWPRRGATRRCLRFSRVSNGSKAWTVRR